jgi:hypothetical protein
MSFNVLPERQANLLSIKWYLQSHSLLPVCKNIAINVMLKVGQNGRLFQITLYLKAMTKFNSVPININEKMLGI